MKPWYRLTAPTPGYVDVVLQKLIRTGMAHLTVLTLVPWTRTKRSPDRAGVRCDSHVVCTRLAGSLFLKYWFTVPDCQDSCPENEFKLAFLVSKEFSFWFWFIFDPVN